MNRILLAWALAPITAFIALTESVLINRFDEVLAKMRTLRDWGVRISLDDFGTGFSSLSYLRKLPITTLKNGQIVRG